MTKTYTNLQLDLLLV